MYDITPLERAVLDAIAAQVGSASLSGQIAAAQVMSRENTGAGFYTVFAIDDDAPSDDLAHPVGNVGAEIAGLELGMGFLLWLKSGVIVELEGCSYEEDTSGLDFERVGFRDVVAHRSGETSNAGSGSQAAA